MCGIAGFSSFRHSVREYEDSAASMRDALGHRGPDSHGTEWSEHACLIHTRLAVVDLEGGKQPMKALRGGQDTVLVYNGELYNTGEIRRELQLCGHRFDGHSDTEVLLHAYLEWGEACVDRLNGIYAFAVWDEKQQSLFLARDRMGVKPLFYAEVDGTLIFASELKALLRHPLVRPEIDRQSIAELLLIGPGRTPGYGVFCGVREVLPGYCGTYTAAGLQLRPYWQLEAWEHTQTFDETLEQVRFLVRDAIKRQTVSDVPLCAFLSGGLDSSIIAALSGVSDTFSVDYADNDRYFPATRFQPDSDNHYIDLMTRHLGTRHHRVTLETEDLVQALFDAVDARDLPGMADVDSSLLLFCKEVRSHATVALSGECADELFGGYPWFRDPTVREQDGFPWSQSTRYRASFLKPGLLDGVDAMDYVHQKYRQTVDGAQKLATDSPLEARMKEMFSLNVSWFMQTLLEGSDAKENTWALL